MDIAIDFFEVMLLFQIANIFSGKSWSASGVLVSLFWPSVN